MLTSPVLEPSAVAGTFWWREYTRNRGLKILRDCLLALETDPGHTLLCPQPSAFRQLRRAVGEVGQEMRSLAGASPVGAGLTAASRR